MAADFGAGPESILHVAQSLFHDHVPGGRGVGATAPAHQAVSPDFRFDSMAELVERHRAEGG